jgi:hypothetical protein
VRRESTLAKVLVYHLKIQLPQAQLKFGKIIVGKAKQIASEGNLDVHLIPGH